MSRTPVLSLLLALAATAGCGRGADAPGGMPANSITVANAGFATPESVAHDAIEEYYYVSNINGSPLEADDNGFISRLSPDGEVVALKFIDGASDAVTLHAPKGIAVAGNYLYVTDITTLRWFDRRTGEPVGSLEVPGATFLNDVTTTVDGIVYFTDSGLRAGAGGFEGSGTDAVYRFVPGEKLDTLAMGPDLGRPNGIAVTGDSVYVVTFGSGELYRVVDGGKADVVALPTGSLDGLVIFDGMVMVSSWDGSAVYRGPVGGTLGRILEGLEAPADIGHDLWRHRLLIPLFNANEVRIVPLAF